MGPISEGRHDAPGIEVTQFTSYDDAGNLLQRVDGNSVTTNYVYDDPESLLTDIEYPATTSLNVHFEMTHTATRFDDGRHWESLVRLWQSQ